LHRRHSAIAVAARLDGVSYTDTVKRSRVGHEEQAGHDKPGPQSAVIQDQLSPSHQIRVKRAEYWLKLGEADEAVRELEKIHAIAAFNDETAKN
jgi:hypothetical protein